MAGRVYPLQRPFHPQPGVVTMDAFRLLQRLDTALFQRTGHLIPRCQGRFHRFALPRVTISIRKPAAELRQWYCVRSRQVGHQHTYSRPRWHACPGSPADPHPAERTHSLRCRPSGVPSLPVSAAARPTPDACSPRVGRAPLPTTARRVCMPSAGNPPPDPASPPRTVSSPYVLSVPQSSVFLVVKPNRLASCASQRAMAASGDCCCASPNGDAIRHARLANGHARLAAVLLLLPNSQAV